MTRVTILGSSCANLIFRLFFYMAVAPVDGRFNASLPCSAPALFGGSSVRHHRRRCLRCAACLFRGFTMTMTSSTTSQSRTTARIHVVGPMLPAPRELRGRLYGVAFVETRLRFVPCVFCFWNRQSLDRYSILVFALKIGCIAVSVPCLPCARTLD